jgi:hypothetical protein
MRVPRGGIGALCLPRGDTGYFFPAHPLWSLSFVGSLPWRSRAGKKAWGLAWRPLGHDLCKGALLIFQAEAQAKLASHPLVPSVPFQLPQTQELTPGYSGSWLGIRDVLSVAGLAGGRH